MKRKGNFRSMLLSVLIPLMAGVSCSQLISDLTGARFTPDTTRNDSASAQGVVFHNPVIPGFHPDPSICRVGQDYYLVNSSFEYFPGIPVFHSRDLVHWRQIGHCLTRKSQLYLTGTASSEGIFAPTIRYDRGTFYVIATDVGPLGNFIVTAKDPAGPWSDPILVHEQGFDPSLFFDDDGKIYYTSEEGTVVQNYHIIQYEIDVANGRFLSEKKVIFQDERGVTEGPHLYKINNTYYLMAAAGGTGPGHCEVIAAGKSPFGPFTDCPYNPILSHRDIPDSIQCTGHADLVEAFDGRFWAVFLAVRRLDNTYSVLGRETFLAPVTWKKGWPIIGNNGHVSLTMKGPLPTPIYIDTLPGRDEFDETTLSFEWCFIRNPASNSYSMTAHPGFLRLNGNGTTLSDVGSPAFVGRRQEHFAMTIRTRLSFNPRSANEEAGLAVRLNEKAHSEIFMTQNSGSNSIAVRLCKNGTVAIAAKETIEGNECFLQVSGTDRQYSFSYSTDGLEWHLLADEEAGSVAPEAIPNCYTGVVLGMYASGNRTACAGPADFDWFEYIPESGY